VSKKRIVLGKLSELDPARARKLAKDTLADIRKGADPALAREEARRAETVADLFASYMREHVRAYLKGNRQQRVKGQKRKRIPGKAVERSSTIDLYSGYLENYVLPAWATRKARSITRQDVKKLFLQVGDQKPDGLGKSATANRLLAFTSGAYTWASANKALPEDFRNPAKGVKRFKETARERFLSPEEFSRLGATLRLAEEAGLPWQPDPTKKIKHAARAENRRVTFDPWVCAAIKLLVTTGLRLREILHLRWEHVDFQCGTVLLLDSKTGRRRVPLGAAALRILADLEHASDYVIAGLDPKTPRSDLQRPWKRISAHAGLRGVRLHDLRHSWASTGAAGGLGLQVVGALLGHRDSETTARYSHFADAGLQRAADAISATLEAQLLGKSGVVVPFRGAAQ
jgi:integrase